MKVLQLISSRGFFGAENVMVELSKELRSSEYLPYIGVIGNIHNPNIEVIRQAAGNDAAVKIFHCNGKFNIRAIFEIRRYVKENKIDIIHSHNYKSNFYALLATAYMKVGRIVTCHNWLGNNIKMGFYEFLDKILLNRFDNIVAVSDVLKEEILRSKVPQNKVTVINNGINIHGFQATGRLPTSLGASRSQAKKLLGIKDDEKVIGTVGRLTPEKGHIYLLKAFKKVALEYPNIKLLIVGEGPLRDNLELGVMSLEIENNVIFTGFRNDIPDILNIIDIFVLSSLKEGTPMALLEAMASRKPVIATKVGDIPKIIKDGYSGLLIEPGNNQELSKSISQLLNDKTKADFLAQNGYEKVKNELSATKMAKSYIKVYSGISHLKNANTSIDNIKIIQIEIAGRGGICHYTYNLLQGLSTFIKTKLITSKEYELENRERNFELMGIFNRFKTNPLFILKLIRNFGDKNVNIIHFQLSQYPLFVLMLVWLAKLAARSKIVITSHNIVSHEARKWEINIYKNIYKEADRIIVHSEHSKKFMQSYFDIADNKISVIPHGNYMFFNENLSSDKRELAIEKVILFFGYIRKYKGLMYLIQAFAKVRKAVPDAKLLIVGKPVEQFEVYQNEIDRLSLNGSVEKELAYAPFYKVKEYFGRASLVALPYLDISQSGVLQLAFGFGKPVVVTAVGGLSEAVENGKNGFIVKSKDVNALAEKILIILQNPDLQKEMGEYSLRLAKTKYSWDNITQATINLYESIPCIH